MIMKRVDVNEITNEHFPSHSFLARAKCHCMGTVHPVLFNCTSCGNIICTEEELEVCTYCGTFSRHYRQSHRGEDDENLRKAIESKVGGNEGEWMSYGRINGRIDCCSMIARMLLVPKCRMNCIEGIV